MHFDTLNIQNLVHNYWKSSMFCSPFPWQRCSQEIHPRQGNIAWGLSLAAIWVIPNNRRFLLRGKKSPPVASRLHRRNLKTKNGVFILKTHQILAKKKQTNKTRTQQTTAILDLFEENSSREITWLSWRHRFAKLRFSKCLPTETQSGVFTFIPFEERSRKAPFLWRITHWWRW